NAQFFQHNPAEAKKLMAAAGYANGFEASSRHITTTQLGDLPKNADALDGMAADIGIRSRVVPQDYATEYIPNVRDAHGQYEGWGYHTQAGGTAVGPAGLMANEYWSRGGSAFHGFSASGKNDQSGDPQLEAMISKARVEQDTEKRRALIFDIQRYLGKAMYAIALPGGTTGTLTLPWPAPSNYRRL